MTTSHIPRRTIVGGILAASLLGGGLTLAFADDAAPAGACPATYTDPAGDAAPGDPALAPAIGDDDLDILGVTHSVDGDQFSSIVKIVKLTDVGPDASPGDIFQVAFTVGGKAVTMKALRDFSGSPFAAQEVTASTSVGGTKQTFPTKAVFDLKASTVTISTAVADLSKAVGKDLTGLPFSAMSALTRADYGFSNSPSPQAPAPLYDDATAPATATYSFGGSCSGGSAPAPVPSATAAPEPSASPAPPSGGGVPAGPGLPAAGCNTFVDAKGDGSTGSQEPTGGAPNDPDLDITGVVFQTTEKAVTSIIRVDKLAAAPSPGIGHYWVVDFSAKGKDVEFASNRLVEPLETVYSQGFLPDVVRIGGTTDKTIKLTATYDTKNSLVILSADRAALEKALAGPLAGTELSKLHAESGFHVVTGYEAADVADAKTGENFAVDSNACFAPPVPPLSNVGVTTAQYGDIASVAAKLVDAAGAPAAGKTVTFALGAAKATATTGADGIAKANLVITEKAGKQSLAIASDDAKTSVDFTVLVEKTALKATAAKGNVTATLLDDDRKPVAGQPITFTAGSKKITTKTNAKGLAKAGFAPGTAVKVTYAGATGMYTAASTTTKA